MKAMAFWFIIEMLDGLLLFLPGAEAKKTSSTFSSCHRPTFPMTADIWSPPCLVGEEEEGKAGSVSFTATSSSASVLLSVIALCSNPAHYKELPSTETCVRVQS